jgi:hypothetical protein
MEFSEGSDDHSSNLSEEDDNETPTRSKRKRLQNILLMISLCTVDDTPTTISEALASFDAD